MQGAGRKIMQYEPDQGACNSKLPAKMGAVVGVVGGTTVKSGSADRLKWPMPIPLRGKNAPEPMTARLRVPLESFSVSWMVKVPVNGLIITTCPSVLGLGEMTLLLLVISKDAPVAA